MAEYWKSTPRYWCKFCSTYIRDTPLERRNHESTGRHQSAIQRNLRTLHKDTERQDREKQRAKDEVARLNGVVSGNTTSAASQNSRSGAGGANATAVGTGRVQRQATAEERKKQLAQLAAMGVAVPEDYRREVAMAGEWETVSVRQITQTPPPPDSKSGIKNEDESKEDMKTEAKAFGVRKRKLDTGENGDEPALEDANREKPWGSRFRKFPRNEGGEEDDIEALLGGAKKPKTEADATPDAETASGDQQPAKIDDPIIKEETMETTLTDLPGPAEIDKPDAAANEEKKEELPGAGIIFKKRKKAVTLK